MDGKPVDEPSMHTSPLVWVGLCYIVGYGVPD
jgi:hypothetical protein